MEQPAIKHRLKHSTKTVQVEGIGNNELSVYTATRGLLPRDRQRGLCYVNSENVQPQRGNVKGVLTCPASCIEDCAGECAFARQTHDRRLWLSDVPGGRAIEVRRIPGLTRPPLVTGRPPAAEWIVGGNARQRDEDSFRLTAARMSVVKAFSSISSSSWKSMARRVLPSRLELNRPEGSSSEAPLKKVSFTALL